MLSQFLENKKLIAGIITIALLAFIIYASLPFISALFGAAILAFIFKPLDRRLRKFFPPVLSATIILVISLILIILPLIFIINGLIEQITLLPSQIEGIRIIKNQIEQIVPFNIEIDEAQLTNQIIPFLTKSITPVFSNIINAMVILFLLFFLLFYLIFYYENLKKTISIKYY